MIVCNTCLVVIGPKGPLLGSPLYMFTVRIYYLLMYSMNHSTVSEIELSMSIAVATRVFLLNI